MNPSKNGSSKSVLESSTTSHDPTASRAVGVADPLPQGDPPTPPAGFVPPKRIGRARRPLHAHLNLARKAADELRASSDYAQRFGGAAPAPKSLAEALVAARGWSDALQKATAWRQYVQREEQLAWKHAFAGADTLELLFQVVNARDPSTSEAYPSLAAFLAARKAAGKRGAATRAKNRKGGQEKNGATHAAPPTPGVTATPSPVDLDAVKAAAVKLLN